jgi:hypothetical protein
MPNLKNEKRKLENEREGGNENEKEKYPPAEPNRPNLIIMPNLKKEKKEIRK